MLFFLCFPAKDELRTTDHAQFLGCMSFLCHVVSTLRTPSGEPYFALFKPCIEALALLLAPDASDEEAACAAYQVSSHSNCTCIDSLWPSNTYGDKDLGQHWLK